MKIAKTLGWAAIAAAFLTMLIAGSASAAQFRAPSYPTSLSGEAVSSPSAELKTASGTIKCTSGNISGTLSGPSSAITVTPTYSGCKAFGTSATATTNSCRYVLHSSNETHPYTGSLDIACTKEGDAIEFRSTGLNCTVKIPAQSSLSTVTFENAAGVKVNSVLSNLKYSEVGSGCIAPGEHTGTYLTNFWIEQVAVASLEAPRFESEKYPSLVSGAGTVTMSLDTGIVSNCSVKPHGSLAAKASSLNVDPEIYGCAAWGTKFAINSNGCGFTLSAVTNSFPYSSGTLGTYCGKEGAAMTFTIPALPGCEYRIPAHAAVSGLNLESTGTGTTRSVKASMAVSGLAYQEIGTNCEHPGREGSLGFNGSSTLLGHQSLGGAEGSQQGLWVE